MKKGNGNRRLILPVILIFSIGIGSGCVDKAQEFLPVRLGELKLDKKLTGQEALDFVNKLHLQPVTHAKNEIGFYRGESGAATIYITRYPDADKAETDFRKMTAKISPQNSVFTDSEFTRIGEKFVYRCRGMGQVHLIFTEQEALVWFAAEPPLVDQLIEDYLAFLTR